MKTFTIENETNAITVYASGNEAEASANSEAFTNEDELANLAAGWPSARLVEIWNSLPGQTPVKKFKNRATAVSRIWKAIQHLGAAPAAEEPEPVAEDGAPVAPQTPDAAPEPAARKKGSTRAKKASAAKPAADVTAPRRGSKTSQVIAMLKREGGTTLEEIMAAMGWQKHTTRAMLSAGGSLTRNHGLIVTSEKIGEKRIYSINS